MKSILKPFQARPCYVAMLGIGWALAMPANAAQPAKTCIPWLEIGAEAGAKYHGDGLTVTPTLQGARLRCAFQRLEGEATPHGLWLSSMLNNALNERFRIMAMGVGRQPSTYSSPGPLLQATFGAPWEISLPDTGTVAIVGPKVRFTRPGLVEEYSAGLDGVQQDFIIEQKPTGTGNLALRLGVSGAKAELAADGVRLVLEKS